MACDQAPAAFVLALGGARPSIPRGLFQARPRDRRGREPLTCSGVGDDHVVGESHGFQQRIEVLPGNGTLPPGDLPQKALREPSGLGDTPQVLTAGRITGQPVNRELFEILNLHVLPV